MGCELLSIWTLLLLVRDVSSSVVVVCDSSSWRVLLLDREGSSGFGRAITDVGINCNAEENGAAGVGAIGNAPCITGSESCSLIGSASVNVGDVTAVVGFAEVDEILELVDVFLNRVDSSVHPVATFEVSCSSAFGLRSRSHEFCEFTCAAVIVDNSRL